jgi:hypothetical protein
MHALITQKKVQNEDAHPGRSLLGVGTSVDRDLRCGCCAFYAHSPILEKRRPFAAQCASEIAFR